MPLRYLSKFSGAMAPLAIIHLTLSPFQRTEFEQFWASYASRPLEGRNAIVASFCPQVFGLYVVKLSVCLALIGGVEVGGAEKLCNNHMVGLSATLSEVYCEKTLLVD